jgi:hypothetical protein
LQTSSSDDALTWANRAIDDEPKNPTGEWCAPWEQLMSVAGNTLGKAPRITRWRLWAPWDSYAWRFAARNTRSSALALRYARRAYELSPLDTSVAGELGNLLLGRGLSGEVEDIARRLGQSRYPVHKLLGRLLMVRFLASKARFGEALEVAREAMQPRPGDAGWILTQRLELAWRAVEIANVLGTARELADLAIRVLVDPVPALLTLASLDDVRYVTAICAYASPPDAERCFSWLSPNKSRLNPAFVDGASYFANGDLRRAARAWRPLIQDAWEQVDLLAEAMVRAFSAEGEHELVSEIEQRNRDRAVLFGGASMAMARAAQDARVRGDRTQAKRLAMLVFTAWKHADSKPPILDEMRRLSQ